MFSSISLSAHCYDELSTLYWGKQHPKSCARILKCFLGHDRGCEETKQEQLSPRPLSGSCTRATACAAFPFLSPYMDNGKITQVLQTSCVSAPLIPFASCPTHPDTWGSGRAGQSLPCPKPPDICLIISWANNIYRQPPCLLATASPRAPVEVNVKLPYTSSMTRYHCSPP